MYSLLGAAAVPLPSEGSQVSTFFILGLQEVLEAVGRLDDRGRQPDRVQLLLLAVLAHPSELRFQKRLLLPHLGQLRALDLLYALPGGRDGALAAPLLPPLTPLSVGRLWVRARHSLLQDVWRGHLVHLLRLEVPVRDATEHVGWRPAAVLLTNELRGESVAIGRHRRVALWLKGIARGLHSRAVLRRERVTCRLKQRAVRLLERVARGRRLEQRAVRLLERVARGRRLQQRAVRLLERVARGRAVLGLIALIVPNVVGRVHSKRTVQVGRVGIVRGRWRSRGRSVRRGGRSIKCRRWRLARMSWRRHEAWLRLRRRIRMDRSGALVERGIGAGFGAHG